MPTKKSRTAAKYILVSLLLVLVVLTLMCISIHSSRSSSQFDYRRVLGPDSPAAVKITKTQFDMKSKHRTLHSRVITSSSITQARHTIQAELQKKEWRYARKLTEDVEQQGQDNTLIFRKGNLIRIVTLQSGVDDTVTVTELQYPYQRQGQ